MIGNLSNKEKELYRRVDEILFYLWDPIGVCDNPMARDEYHSYAPRVFKLLIEDAKVHELAAYLIKLEAGSMGMSANNKRCLEIAKLLIDTADVLLE